MNLFQKQNASVFDIIGPNMVGPSSSHTAGALRISYLAQSLVRAKIVAVQFHLFGSFARTYQGHGTDRALVAGILGMKTDDLRIPRSFEIAEEVGLRFQFLPELDAPSLHPNTVQMHIHLETGHRLLVEGISIGGGQAMITRINEFAVELSGNLDTLLVEHYDKPGVLLNLLRPINQEGINVATLKLYRESKGKRAFTIIEADDKISGELEALISGDKNVLQCILIQAGGMG